MIPRPADPSGPAAPSNDPSPRPASHGRPRNRPDPIATMKTASLRLPIVGAALLALAATAHAQNDRIVLHDGTVIDKVTVTGFDLRNASYRKGGGSQEVGADMVADLQVARVKDAYKRAEARRSSDTGPAAFLDEADRINDKFLSQFGYAEAAKLLLRRGQFGDAFTVLGELQQKYPDSGFLPLTYSAKIDYYLSKGKSGASDAAKVAAEYETASQTKGYPMGFQLEARFYKLLAQAVAGDLEGSRLESAMRTLAGEAARYPQVADRARLAIADVKRANGDSAGAEEVYAEILGKDNSSAAVRAGAYLGMGQVLMAKGPRTDPEPYREALLNFLRVYLETPDAPSSTIAQALDLGAQAAEKWGGEDSGRMNGYLKYRLRTDYPEYEPAK